MPNQTTEQIYLKPCPFCGSYCVALESDPLIGHHIRCSSCGAETRFIATREESAAAWNRRTRFSAARGAF